MEFASKLSFQRNVTEAKFSKLYLTLASARRGYEAFQKQSTIVGITPKITEVIIVRKRISVTY